MIYRPEIDGLRAIAVLPVILFHAGFDAFDGGFVGVDVFFVISGYLISTIIIKELTAGQFDLANFYMRRARRILPALFFITLLCIPLAWFWLLPREMVDFSQSVVAVITFSSNFLFWKENGYFLAAAELKPLLHTWSLAVEEQYYILFPLLLMLLWRLGRHALIATLSTILIISLAAAHYGAYHDPVAAFFLLTTRGWELLIGVLVALYLHRPRPFDSRYILQFGSAVGLVLIAIAVFAFDQSTPFPSLYALVPTVGTAMVILFAEQGTVVFRILSNRAMVGVGLMSYSAYLWHQPLIAFARYRSPSEPPVLLIASLVALTFPLAYISWRYIERPFRGSKSYPTRPFIVGCIVIALLLATFGSWGHFSNGFPDRYTQRYNGIVSTVAEQFSSAFLYVSKRWKTSLEMREFDTNLETVNVLLIGDSYGMDVANAIYESGLNQKYYLSTYHISRLCGNVWTDKDLASHIAPTDREKCGKHARYADEQLQLLMSAAEEIWLVSSWQKWHLEYLPETIERLSNLSDAQLRIFGRKNFGTGLSFYQYLKVTENGSRPYTVKFTEDHMFVNETMARIVNPDIFIDISFMLCGNTALCVNSTPDGALISYDGNHLTQEGATYLGTLLVPLLTDSVPFP